MYFVYLLENKAGRWYIGFTPDKPENRLFKHNKGKMRSTKSYIPYRLIYYEAYLNRSDALGREKFLKSGAGRTFLKKQLKKYLVVG
jgi:putative endonuclease